jgi:SRSO17 transposase
MTGEQIASLVPAMSAFLEPYPQAAFPTTRSAKHLSHYTLGLLSDLKRKSIEPIALASGVAVRTLQEFLSHMPWDHAAAQRLLFRQVAQRPGARLSVGVIDESAHAKQGPQTPGVQRQYCGQTGKIDNCVVGVHLLYVAPGERPNDSAIDNPLTCALASDLYLPKAWADDLDRRREAGIPDELVFRTKGRIALDLLKDSVGQGLRFNYVTFDEEYGKVPAFWEQLNALGQWAVGEVPSHFHAWATPPKYQSLQAPFASKQVLGLAAHSPVFYSQEWREMHVKDTTRGRETWKVKHAMVQIPDSATGRPSERKYHLIIAWRLRGDGRPEGVQGGREVKYFLSNAPEGTDLLEILRAAFCRWHVEKWFERAKQEAGLGAFEVRTYRSLIRHWLCCRLTMLFLAEQTTRLRGEKSEDHLRAGGGGVAAAAPADYGARLAVVA